MDKLDLVIDKIDDLKESHGKRMDSIDYNLSEHMRRTDILEKLHKDNLARVEKLEETPKALNKLKSWVLYASSLAGAIILITKLIGE